jgi:alpha-ketoglutarate-dependent taurine dioxygenase
MSPSRIAESKIAITPLKHSADKECKLGATITGLDLNNVSDEDLEALREATHKYQLVVIKDQHELDPIKH